MKKLLLSFIFLFSFLHSGEITFSYKEALTSEDKQNLQLVKNSKRIADLELLLNDVFILKNNIKVVFGADDGPYFDPAKNLIAMPYFFVEETKQKFQKANYAKTQGISIDTAVIDVMIHSIIHEFGHALIAMYDIPILGREEDAVDNLANILLIDFFKDGDDVLLTNADIFDLYGDEKKVLEEQDFMDEHSLDLQRFYSLLCFVYASNTQKYEKMLNEYKFPMYRKDMCVNELNNVSSSWYQVLKPYMRN